MLFSFIYFIFTDLHAILVDIVFDSRDSTFTRLTEEYHFFKQKDTSYALPPPMKDNKLVLSQQHTLFTQVDLEQ